MLDHSFGRVIPVVVSKLVEFLVEGRWYGSHGLCTPVANLVHDLLGNNVGWVGGMCVRMSSEIDWYVVQC